VASRNPFTFQMYIAPSADPQAIFRPLELKEARAKSQLILKCSFLWVIAMLKKKKCIKLGYMTGWLAHTYVNVDITWFLRKSNSLIVSSLTEHMR